MTDYLTLAEVLAIHEDQIERYGGSHGVRDPGQFWKLLCSKCSQGYYPDLIGEAAALWESLSQNHPFIDGNKHTVFACIYTFLATNGVEIRADAENTYRFLADLYDHNCFEYRVLDQWLRANSRHFSST